jgi:hypothetical protein
LDQHEGSSGLADLIRTWADCVEELCDQTALQHTINSAVEAGEKLLEAIKQAESAARAFHPLAHRPPTNKPAPSTVFSGGHEYGKHPLYPDGMTPHKGDESPPPAPR